jgi:hypothetical protein
MARTRLKNNTDVVNRYILKDEADCGYSPNNRLYFQSNTLYSYGSHWPLALSYRAIKNIADNGKPEVETRFIVNGDFASSATRRHYYYLVDALKKNKQKFIEIKAPKSKLRGHSLSESFLAVTRLLNSNDKDQVSVINQNIDLALLETLKKSIRARTYKLDEKKLIREAGKLQKAVADIPYTMRSKQLNNMGNELIEELYSGAIDKPSMEQMTDYFTSLKYNNRGRDQIFYNFLMNHFNFDKFTVEGEAVFDMMAEA